MKIWKILEIAAIILLSLVILAVVTFVICRIGIYIDYVRYTKYFPLANSGQESTWKSDDGRMVFSMDGSSDDGYGTIIQNGEEVPIIIKSTWYGEISIIIGDETDETSEGYRYIGGIPKQRNESKFVVNVGYSTHPDYPDGEKIVFTKVE